MKKSSSALIAYCEAQLGKPYWFGTFGQISNQSILNYNRGRFPAYYSASDFEGQLGVKVHDCIGLIKGFLWSDSPTEPAVYLDEACEIDYSADTMLDDCQIKGIISTIPEVAGTLVFIKTGAEASHVGVYIGNGEVIEAKGHKYGVVKTKLAGRGWTHWGKCPYIEYETEEDDMPNLANMTDEEKIAFLRELMSPLKDNDTEFDSEEARQFCIEKGIIKGDGSTPPNYMWESMPSREALALMLFRFAKATGLA